MITSCNLSDFNNIPNLDLEMGGFLNFHRSWTKSIKFTPTRHNDYGPSTFIFPFSSIYQPQKNKYCYKLVKLFLLKMGKKEIISHFNYAGAAPALHRLGPCKYLDKNRIV